jgi:hypothetical protein
VRPCDVAGIWGSTLGGIAFGFASFYRSFVYTLASVSVTPDGCMCKVLLEIRRILIFGCCGEREKVLWKFFVHEHPPCLCSFTSSHSLLAASAAAIFLSCPPSLSRSPQSS